MEPFERIRAFLAEVRRELNRVSLFEAGLAIVIALALTAVATLGVASALGVGDGRWGWTVGPLGVVLAGLAAWRLWVTPRRRRRSDAELALWVEARVDTLESGLVTAVQTAPTSGAPASRGLGYSTELARESASLTADRLVGLRPSALPSRQRLKHLAGGAAGTLAAVALLALAAPGLFTGGVEALTVSPNDETADGERLVPVAVSQLSLEIIPPEYTGVKPRKLQRSAGDLEAVRGSEVRFATTALYPATEAMLVLESDPDTRHPLVVEQDGTVRGSFRVGDSDRYQFVLVDAQGASLHEKTWRAVDSRRDVEPEVQLLLPETDLEVKPDDQVAFFFEAADDYGLERVELVVVDDAGAELDRRVVRSPRGERLSRGDEAVAVARLGLEAGDSVDVHFEAFDLNTLSGPGHGRSGARRITLYSPEAEHDRLLGDLDRIIDQMIDVLADRLESPIEDKDRFRLNDYVALGQVISSSSARVIEELTQLYSGLSTDALASDDLRLAVREVRDSLQDVHDQESVHLRRAVLGTSASDDEVVVALLFGANQEGAQELESGVFRLKRLLDESRKESVLDAGRELLETQNEIMELLKQLKETSDPEALKAAMKKLKKLQEKLAKLQEELAKLRERAPYENQNPTQRPSDNQQSMQDMQSTMEKIEQLLAEGKIDEAMALLEELNKNTQELMAALQSDLDSDGSMSSAARKKAQEVAEQLDELADGQRGLKGETGEAEREIDERQARELQEQAEAALEDAREEARALREQLEALDGTPLHDSDEQALEQLREDAAALERDLERGSVGQAAKQARELAEKAEALKQEIAESEARELDEERLAGLQECSGGVGDGQGRAQKLAEQLEGMIPKPGEGLKPGEEGELQRLGQRQGELREKLERLRESLPELAEDMPGVDKEVGEPLEGAGQAMDEAGKELGGRRPDRAQQRQQEALERLEQAQQSMQEQMRQRSGQGGQEQTGVNDPRAKVEIPEDDPYAAPRDFREDVMRAMKERAPEKYRDAIERFYEELIK